ncbi:MAG: LysR family transcriptional regulator [Betaproteobacteria bacterium]|nr:LysR family transcriptional regulator [Betaproteobacteria bacterium]
MKMELRDIEYFAVVAEHGQVGRAAEALGLGQPALSKSLRRLEEAVQTKLLRRTPKGVELTEAGAALLSRVSRLRLALGDVAREVADIGQGRTGHLRIGALPGFVEHPLSAACSALLEDAPNVTLTVTVETTHVLLSALRNGELDLVVIPTTASPHGDLIQEHLFDDEFVVIASVNHRLAKRKRVAIADIAQERWALMGPNAPATHEFHRAFQANGLPPPRITMMATSLFLRDHLVASSDMLGFSSRRVAHYAAPRHRFASRN